MNIPIRYFSWKPPVLPEIEQLNLGHAISNSSKQELIDDFISKSETPMSLHKDIAKAYCIYFGCLLLILLVKTTPEGRFWLTLTGALFFIYYATRALTLYKYKTWLNELEIKYTKYTTHPETGYKIHLWPKVIAWQTVMFFSIAIPSYGVYLQIETNEEQKAELEIFTVWAAQGPFSSAEEAAKAYSNTIHYFFGKLPNNKQKAKMIQETNDAVVELKKSFDQNPEGWENIRMDYIQKGSPEFIEIGISLKK
jgi:hypothetical protein